jgi:ribosome biogenesis GTPase A
MFELMERILLCLSLMWLQCYKLRCSFCKFCFFLDLHKSVKKMNLATSKELDIISDTIGSIDDIFLVVIVGEFNSGKSTLINSLLGSDYLKSGILPTTVSISSYC